MGRGIKQQISNRREWEKILVSTLFFNVFREILHGNKTYFSIVNKLDISTPSISESLNALEFFDIIKRNTESTAKDKRTVNLEINKDGLEKFFRNWLVSELSREKETFMLPNFRMNDIFSFAKRYSEVVVLKNFETLFVAYVFSSASEEEFSTWILLRD